MYPVSNEYIEKIMSSSVYASWYGSITTQSDKNYVITERNIALSSSRFSHEVVSGNSLEIGTAYLRELDLKLYLDYDVSKKIYTLNGISVDRYDFFDAEIKLYFRLYYDHNRKEYEDVPIGSFIASDAERSSDTLSLTAYDYMTKFNKPFSAESVGTPYEFLQYGCEQCGVELGMTQQELEAMTNGTRQSYPYEPATYVKTWQDMIGYIASMLCANAMIGHDNKLYLKSYEMVPTRTISSRWRYRSSMVDYEVHYNTMTEIDSETKDTLVIKADDEGKGLQYNMGLNPLFQFGLMENKLQGLQAVMDKLNTIYYTPFDVEVPLDPSLSVMDVLEFTDLQTQEGKYAAITSIEYSLNGSMIIKSVGENPLLASRETSQERDLSNLAISIDGKTMYYYDFLNINAIDIKNNQQATIIEIRYATASETHIDFHAELTYNLTLNEATEGEAQKPATLTVTYFINDEEVTEYHPITQEFNSGIHILHLLYVYMAQTISRGVFRVMLRVEDGSIHIDKSHILGYIAGQGLATKDSSIREINISETFPGYLLSGFPIQKANLSFKFGENINVSQFINEPIQPTDTFKIKKLEGNLRLFEEVTYAKRKN